MQLDTMVEQFRTYVGDSAFASLSFEERLGLLVDAEWSVRQSRRLLRLIRSAQLYFPGACIEDIEYHADRKLDKALITKFSTCNCRITTTSYSSALRELARHTLPVLLGLPPAAIFFA